jgi:hypothetical protein
MTKLLLERAATMTWEIVDLFNNYDEIDEWIKENYGVTFDEFKTEIEEEEDYTPTKQDWYDELELNIREIESKNL